MNERENINHQLLGQMVHVEVDRPVGHLHGDLLYPINYGYIPGLIAGDGEEQDAYILGVSSPVSAFEGQVVGAVCRKDDCEDKLVVAPEGMVFHQGQIAEAVHFQEQYFDSYIVSLFRKSCGVVPFRQVDDHREYLIVLQSGGSWSFPKGHMEAGETEEETALRELWEETGLGARLDTGKTATTEYPITPGVRKQVVFFLGQVSGTPKAGSGEIESLKWVRAENLGDYLYPDTIAACAPLLEVE